jgi:hypothetical protein
MVASRQYLLISLDNVLAFHPGVVARYCREHNASAAEGQEVFREMLKWLYLGYRSTTDQPESFACSMFPEIEKIDWMWHTFLLFTRDYAAFCDRYFGFFLHHVPNEDEEEAPAPLDEDTLRERLQEQYAFVYDVLGTGTLLAWYDEGRYAVRSQRC